MTIFSEIIPCAYTVESNYLEKQSPFATEKNQLVSCSAFQTWRPGPGISCGQGSLMSSSK